MSSRLNQAISTGRIIFTFSSLKHISLALWHLFVLLPLSAFLAVALHVTSKPVQNGHSEPRTWPIRQMKSWSWDETTAVAITAHALTVCKHLEQLPFTPSMEWIIPQLSHMVLGVRHQGWQIQCEAVTIPAIPTKEVDDVAEAKSTSPPSGRPRPQRVLTGEALPYSFGLSSLLRGQVAKGIPISCPALWLWKTQAAHVKEGKVVAVKADSEHGGLGCGEAGNGEKVILLLAGSGLSDNGPVVGPMAWTITRQSGLRMLIIKTRKLEDTAQPYHFASTLQDALAGYAYLVDRLGFLPSNITLLGEGSGASLCVSLTLYLSALSQTSKSAARMGRPGKLLLFSPWCDMTVSKDILRQNAKVDVIDVESQLGERSRYIDTFQQRLSEEQTNRLLKELYERYRDEQNDSETEVDLIRLGRELPDTIDALGPSHPLISPGMPQSCNPYTQLAMQLLGSESGNPIEILICAGSAEAHITEARSLASNLASVKGLKIDYVEGEDKGERLLSDIFVYEQWVITQVEFNSA